MVASSCPTLLQSVVVVQTLEEALADTTGAAGAAHCIPTAAA